MAVDTFDGEIGLLQLGLDALARMAAARYGVMHILGEQGETIYFLHTGIRREEVARLANEAPPRGFGLLGTPEDGEVIRLEVLTKDRGEPSPVPPSHPKLKRLLGVPLATMGKVYGQVYLAEKTGGPFTSEDEEIAISVASKVAMAVESHRRANQWRAQLEAIHRLAREFAEERQPARLLQQVVEAATRLIGADYGVLAVFDKEGGVAQFLSSGLTPEERETIALSLKVQDFLSAVCREEKTLRLNGMAAYPLVPGIPPPHPPAQSLLATPVRFREESFGTLCLTKKTGTFNAEDEQLLVTLSANAAAAIQNARLFETVTQKAEQNARIAEERRLALEELKTAQERLVRSETLQALGEMASGAAHHLNNMLAVVVARVQLLRMTVDDAAIQGPLEVLEQAAMDGAETVRRLQAFGSGRPSQEMAAVDLAQIAKEGLEFTRPRWRDEAQVKGSQIEPHLELIQVPPVFGAASELREVVTNLILNAVDAMPGGGRIALKSWSEKEWVCLSVSDNGMGMSDEVRRRAFEPFFSTKGLNRAGLGLSVAYGIVKRHGGKISLESWEGKGTTVTLRFPYGVDQIGLGSGNPLLSSTAGQPAPVRPARILVIDDEAGVRAVLAAVLVTQGHVVDQAASGPEGLAMLEGGCYDVVITDLGMPEMTGWQVAREVKSRWPGTPIALVTGWGESIDQKIMADHGVEALLLKPFSIEKVRALLARLLGQG